jgi:hypothetical protein
MIFLAAASKPYIDWTALGKIALAVLFGGCGVVIVFGILLLGIKHASGAKSGGQRAGFYGVAAVCGAICIGVVVVGIYAMAHKPASKPSPAPKSKSAAVYRPSATSTKLIASAP